MKFLFFITFIIALTFSEVGIHIVNWQDQISSDFDLHTDDSNESENSEESKEDKVEEDKLIEDIKRSSNVTTFDVTELPCSYNILLSQSLRKIHLPPPDVV